MTVVELPIVKTGQLQSQQIGTPLMKTAEGIA